MKINFGTLFILLFSVVLISCNSNSKKETDTKELSEKASIDVEAQYEIYMSNIDLNDSLLVTNSLYFTKEDGSSLAVAAFLDQKGEVVKLIEKAADGTTNRYENTTYYVKNGLKFVTIEHFEDTTKPTDPVFIERKSFYDVQEKPIITKVRSAKFEEDLEKSSLNKVNPYNCSIERALSAINQQGRFVPKFQGLVFSGRSTYITVGEDDEDGYVSALLIQYENETTRKLKKNQKAMIGKPLDLQFQKVVDDTGFEFQLLLGVKEVEN